MGRLVRLLCFAWLGLNRLCFARLVAKLAKLGLNCFSKLVGLLACLLGLQVLGWLVDWLVTWLLACLLACLAGYLVDWLLV